MLAIAIGTTMAVLDGAIVNIALPTIARQLHETPSATIWVVNAYQIAIVVSLLPLAALGERVGYARVYLAGLVLFTAGSLACALSGSLPALNVARAAQGLGAAGLMSVNGALVRYTYPDAMLGRGVGLNALVVSFAAAVGPTLASGILSFGPWQWLFAVNVPFGVLNLVLAWRALPPSHRSTLPFDWASAGLNAVAFGLFFVGVDALSRGGGSRWVAALELGAALAAGVWLVRRGADARAPLIPLDLLRNRVFALSVAASVCSFTAYMLAFVSLPFHFETALGRSTVETGLLMTPWPAALGLVAPIAGRLSDRLPAAVLGGAGMAVLAAGLLLMAMLPADASTTGILWRMAVCGLGFGLFQAPNNRTMLSAAPRERAGAAGGMLATARLTGMTGGAALAAVVFAAFPQRAEPISLSIGVALALAAAVASLSRWKR
ncbi:MAG: MFS transporter [Geminicoccaceae bacterium]|nr:MFS transporter [Geminicoccaceae bacterium]